MEARIDRDGCIGCGLCAQLCPDVFRMDEENLAEVYAQPSEDARAAVMDAVDSCPVGVISLEG